MAPAFPALQSTLLMYGSTSEIFNMIEWDIEPFQMMIESMLLAELEVSGNFNFNRYRR